MKRTAAVLVAWAMLAAGSGVRAQSVMITPSIGAYIPASDFYDLRDDAVELRADKDRTLALGLAVEVAWLRGTLAYASGAQLNLEGVADSGEIGDGTLLVGAADVVLRPIPRLIIVQPYLLGGVGFKNESYDTDQLTDFFPEDQRTLAFHIGLGAEVMLGSIGFMAEITDFITRDADDDWSEHDAFIMVGMKFRLGR